LSYWRYAQGVNINLQSKTIEDVLAARKKQCQEMLDARSRELENASVIEPLRTRFITLVEQCSGVDPQYLRCHLLYATLSSFFIW